ncbi:MAG TPA: PAS domain S-box protein [Bacteroidales bacterium]|nr:PAS domain S-box protein [Bacteroidales bacterium]
MSSQNEKIHVEFNVNIVDKAGEKIDIVFIRDISTIKQAEKGIRESEENYKGLFNNSSEGILIMDSSGVILDTNKSGHILFGYGKDELLGKTIYEITYSTQTSIDEVTRSVRLAYQGHSQKIEFLGIKKNNDLVPIDMVFNRGDYFGLSVIFAMCHDITDRKNAEAVLRESEEKYRTLTEQIPVGLYRILSNGQIVYCNPAFAAIFGFSSSQAATGSNIKSFLSNFNKWLVDCATTKLPIEVEMLRADGSTIWVQNILQPNVTENPDATTLMACSPTLPIAKSSLTNLQRTKQNSKPCFWLFLTIYSELTTKASLLTLRLPK